MKKNQGYCIVIIILIIIIGLLYYNSIKEKEIEEKEIEEKEKFNLLLNRNSEKVNCLNNAWVDVHGELADCGLFYWQYTADNLVAIKKSRDCYSNIIIEMPDLRAICNSI